MLMLWVGLLRISRLGLVNIYFVSMIFCWLLLDSLLMFFLIDGVLMCSVLWYVFVIVNFLWELIMLCLVIFDSFVVMIECLIVLSRLSFSILWFLFM